MMFLILNEYYVTYYLHREGLVPEDFWVRQREVLLSRLGLTGVRARCLRRRVASDLMDGREPSS